jgi:tRNA(Ser,Leu) C12 N-acetylase TAN1
LFAERKADIMVKEANLLVAFDPNHKETALNNIKKLLDGLKEKSDVIKAEEGIAEFLVEDAKKIVRALSIIFSKEADKFLYISRWIPIDKWCKSTAEDLQKHVKEIAKGIKKEDRWKMELRARHTKEKPNESKLILKLTEVINSPKVDLQRPDKIVRVEIIGNKAGLSLLDKKEILNTAK